MKHQTILFIFLILSSIGYTQDKGKLNFEEKVIDFGELKENTVAKKTISFKNSGDQKVTIDSVRSTGHIKIEQYPKNPIPPENEKQITISYNTKKIGPIRRTITVFSDAENPIISLKVKGIVVKN